MDALLAQSAGGAAVNKSLKSWIQSKWEKTLPDKVREIINESIKNPKCLSLISHSRSDDQGHYNTLFHWAYISGNKAIDISVTSRILAVDIYDVNYHYDFHYFVPIARLSIIDRIHLVTLIRLYWKKSSFRDIILDRLINIEKPFIIRALGI